MEKLSQENRPETAGFFVEKPAVASFLEVCYSAPNVKDCTFIIKNSSLNVGNWISSFIKLDPPAISRFISNASTPSIHSLSYNLELM
ncbi:hypothetical protein EBO34_01005 [Alteribacter keqinensis]|uniref:Uncharacterized protein n=1 Tax=Alteribacter keqinensis TaxID=2483800 RepID=A0A3M7TTG3_9BACI|nr:hypothetical protein EBO34_01005 [Alteribacter keqinensis]